MEAVYPESHRPVSQEDAPDVKLPKLRCLLLGCAEVWLILCRGERQRLVHPDNTELGDQGGLTSSYIRDASSLGWRLGLRLLVYPITSFSEKPWRPRFWFPLVLAQAEGSQWDVWSRADALGQKTLSKEWSILQRVCQVSG